jgi:SAM-dependent methyltransferase
LPLEYEARALFDDSYFTGGILGGYDDYIADEALHRENARLRLAMLRRLGIVAPGRLLDVGCAHGFFLDEARENGWRVRGADVSRTAAAHASTCFGLDVAADLVGATRDAQFDVVTFFQLLQHVAAPLELLEQARHALAPHGTLVIETWDRGSPIAQLMRSHWHVVAPPSVVWLWNHESMAALLASAGFTMTTQTRTKKRVSLRFVTSLLEGRSRPIERLGGLLKRSPLRDRSFVYHLGDLVTVTAVPTRSSRPQRP